MENSEKYWERMCLLNNQKLRMCENIFPTTLKQFYMCINIRTRNRTAMWYLWLTNGKGTCIYRSQDVRAEKQEAIIHKKIRRKNKKES